MKDCIFARFHKKSGGGEGLEFCPYLCHLAHNVPTAGYHTHLTLIIIIIIPPPKCHMSLWTLWSPLLVMAGV